MNSFRLQFLKIAERWGSFFRLLVSVIAGIWLGYSIVSLILLHFNNGHFVLTSQKGDVSLFVQMGIALILIITCYVLNFVLDNARLNIYHQIYDDESVMSYHEKLEKEQREGTYIPLILKNGCKNPEKELENLIGLASVKRNVEKLKALFEYEKKSGRTGKEKVCRHYAFLGNPGTGKTTVARIFAGLLYNYGLIKRNVYLECTGNDLTGEYAGLTKKRVDAIYKKVQGGVLFIDEAYILQGQLAEEAIAQLLVKMESDPYTVVIFAGYTGPMLKFLDINPGLSSRVSQQIYFADYEAEDLVRIFEKFCKTKDMLLSNDAQITLRWVFEQKKERVSELGENFSNGRYARNCFDSIYQQHALNKYGKNKKSDGYNTIESQDILDIAHELLELQ